MAGKHDCEGMKTHKHPTSFVVDTSTRGAVNFTPQAVNNVHRLHITFLGENVIYENTDELIAIHQSQRVKGE